MTQRTQRLMGLAGALIVGLTPALALAAGGGGEHHAPEHVPTSVYFQTVNLLILFGLLIYFLRKPLREYLVQRQDSVREALLSAQRAQEEAEARSQELRARIASLEAEAVSHRAMQAQEAKEEAARVVSAANQRAAAIEAQVQRTLDDELRRVRSSLRTEVLDLAMKIARDMVKSDISEADHSRLYGEYVTHLNKTEVN